MMNHTALIRLGTLLLVSTISVPTAAQSESNSRPPTREPRITFLDQPTPEAHDIIVWALERFHDAGLQVPDLEVSFPALCGGKAALYHVGRRFIEFCHINKRTAVHELAHAWDDTSGAVDREAFMKMRGVSVWWGGREVPTGEQGSEHLAQIIAWGLMDVGTRGVPQLPANSVSELTEAFVMLTGGVQPRP